MLLFGEREDDFPEIDLLDNGKKKSEDMSKFETIIGARNSVTGNIEGASPICINGKLIGNINSTSYVYISKTGSVEGSVTADHLVLLGNITGDSINAGMPVLPRLPLGLSRYPAGGGLSAAAPPKAKIK